jgi:hypothetical protein
MTPKNEEIEVRYFFQIFLNVLRSSFLMQRCPKLSGERKKGGLGLG